MHARGCACTPYCAVGLDVWSFQGDGDAVEEDEDQNHVVEQFVRDHALAPRTASEPGRKSGELMGVGVCVLATD